MTLFWIDIENKTDERQGNGPINTAVAWERTSRLSRAGSIRFTMPAVDERAAMITSKRYARCKTTLDGKPTTIGRGIIEEIKTTIPTTGEVMLEISGDDLLRELTWRSVGALKIQQTSSELLALDALRHDPTAKTNVSLTSGAMSISASHYIYLRLTEPYSAWNVTLAVKNTNAGTLSAQFYSVNEESNGWESIAINDGTSLSGKTLGKNGTISWTIPNTWGETSHDGKRGYWIRFKVSNTTSTITFTTNKLTGPGETTNGPQLIMSFAPANWELDKDYASTTLKAAKWQFNGETVLAALIKLAELTGENFRVNTQREIAWLQTNSPDSHLRAVRHTGAYEMHHNNLVCLIVDFEETQSSHDSHVGRIYPIGSKDITLAETTRTPPSGYALGQDAVGHYLEHAVSLATYEIHTWLKVPGAKTADELFDAAYEALKTRKDINRSYRMKVTKLVQPLFVGDSIHVEYRRIIGEYVAYDIDEDFTVLELTDRIDQNGRRTVSMIIASIARWPQTDAEELAKLL